MELLVTYDVGTVDRDGQKRLRRVAKICEGYGHRVQQSVFEIVCEPAQQAQLEADLLSAIDQRRDSVRIYRLTRGSLQVARHLGAATIPTHRGDIII